MLKTARTTLVTGVVLVIAAAAFFVFTDAVQWPTWGSDSVRAKKVMLYAANTNGHSILVKYRIRSNLRGVVMSSQEPGGDWLTPPFSAYQVLLQGEVLDVVLQAGVVYIDRMDSVACAIETEHGPVARDRHVKNDNTPPPDVLCLGKVIYG